LQILPDEKSADFRLVDSHGYITLHEYNALHDPHLKDHFNKPTVQRDLKCAKLVDKNMTSALCSQKEANKYRLAIRLMNLQRVHQELQKMVIFFYKNLGLVGMS